MSSHLDTRYVQLRRGHGYYYNPPKEALEAGVFDGVERRLGMDLQAAARQADRLNKMLDQWRARGKRLPRVTAKVTPYSFESLCKQYYTSHFFDDLTTLTQQQYTNCLTNLCQTEIQDGKKTRLFGELMLVELVPDHCYAAYNVIRKTRGNTAAHMTKRLLRRILGIACSAWSSTYGVQINVASGMKVSPVTAREQLWEEAELNIFVNKSAEVGLPSLGYIALTCYELMQRHKDVRLLKRTSFRKMNTGPEAWFTQTKRSKEVWITIPDHLADIMDKAIAAGPDGCEYVFPCELTGNPWQRNTFARKAREVMDAAGLSKDLQIRDLRRTAATEGGAAGLTEDELMAIGGWKSRNSISPYVQKTRQAAASGQEKRRKHRDG